MQRKNKFKITYLYWVRDDDMITLWGLFQIQTLLVY